MEKIKNFIKIFFAHKIFKIIMWVFFILCGLFLILVIYRFFYLNNQEKIDAQVIKIHNTKLTVDDVLGKNLPSDPGAQADATVQGIDANNNGIRDDVELAVFKEYPDSAKTRAVLLQYALALQMEVIQPMINTITATEVVREQSKGFQCIGSTIINSESQQAFEKLNNLVDFVKNKQFNTKERKNSRINFLEKVRSYSDLESVCDIDYSNLPN
ncbi:MAG: hypothetical protein WC839_00795 [Candidatus Paceibacterota bacterium]